MRIEVCEYCGDVQNIQDGLDIEHVRPGVCDDCAMKEAYLDQLAEEEELQSR